MYKIDKIVDENDFMWCI